MQGDLGVISVDQILNLELDLEIKPDKDIEIVISKTTFEGLVDVKGNVFKRIESGDILAIHRVNFEILKKHGLMDKINF